MTRPADLIITHADIHTMDPSLPRAEAIAVHEGRIVALGDNADIERMAGAGTRRIDAQGRLMLPGLQDTHVHFQLSSADLYHNASLYAATNRDELLATIREFAERHPNKAWIRGVGFSSSLFSPDELTKELLDSVTGGRPALMLASDYHNGWANSAAFEIAGVKPDSPEPENGSYVRKADGTPKGWLLEDAIWAMNRIAPGYTDDEYLEAMKHYSKAFNRRGITGVLDAMVSRNYMKNYQASFDRGDLTLRVRATSKIFAHKPLDEQLRELQDLRETYRGDRVCLHSAKFFLDGVLESGTAVFLEPRSDTGGNAELMFTQEQINRYFAAFDREKFQLHVHTIGDGAVRAAVDGIEYARQQNGTWDSRHQLAHLQVVDPADIPRFKSLDILANFQPLWAQPQPEADAIAEAMLGPVRSQWIFPIGAFVRTGVTCMMSSDWGVSTYDPFQILQSAVTRQNADAGPDGPVHNPQHRISIEDALRGYTLNAAHAAWRDDCTGSLSAGKYADLIVLDRNLFEISPYEIGQTQVLLTLLEGQEVHRDPGFA
ncbi:amidohydrolase [Pseudomonas sp. BN417]|uniref:amidohydrolase n=1 Tax=Pseudomonas sp. BN417 TaxID=2567890 RepID=UPI002453E102|nr:amidohydrolase [Pseudomonas sp. BN417]MDH4557831.1 amidohydrolase [Pseudomonas sp. BN417]